MTNIVRCPACAGQETHLNRRLASAELRVCDRCGVRFSHPMQHPGQAWYEESDIYEEVRWNLPSPSRLGSRWEFREAIERMKGTPAPILDVGCGRGDFLKLAHDHGYDAWGVDLNKTLVRVAEEAYGLRHVEQGTLDEFVARHPGRSFGAVTAFEVLEHLPSPDDFLLSCRRALAEGGRLIVSVPGFERVPTWVNSDVDLPPHHLVLWTQPALRMLLERHGFKQVETARKPLLLADVMYHAVRFIPGLQAPGAVRRLLRAALKVAIVPFWLVLRFHPRAGGFTLLATGVR